MMPVRRPDPSWWAHETWDGQPLRNALRARDLAPVFGFLAARGWSRASIAAATGLSENRVRGIAQRRQRITSYEVLERVAEGLRVERGLMGLAYTLQPGARALADTAHGPTSRS
ncbi:hypothetical protein GCM10009682_24360 [Luedemannella flava]|uniref:XRE family transcriptional regulator n=1 Tax=Luedemannella flava TaxID=349316 RepID=A0ABP4Y5Y7_9ACTN